MLLPKNILGKVIAWIYMNFSLNAWKSDIRILSCFLFHMKMLNVAKLSRIFERATFYKRRPIVVGTICLVANANARNSQQVKTYSKNKNISFTVFYDWINTKIKSITQLSKPSLKEQNNGSDLHHYKHMSTSHFLRNNTHKWFAKH